MVASPLFTTGASFLGGAGADTAMAAGSAVAPEIFIPAALATMAFMNATKNASASKQNPFMSSLSGQAQQAPKPPGPLSIYNLPRVPLQGSIPVPQYPIQPPSLQRFPGGQF